MANLAEAERQFETFQFEDAIAALNPLIDRLRSPGVGDPGQLARCLELRGRAAFNLGRVRAARSDFVNLLETDSSARLPADASPRLIELFDSVRAETVGTLFVNMDPPGSLIVGGREFVLEAFNETLNLVAGSHTIVASLPGHREQQLDVVVTAGQEYALDVRLERVYGSVTVATTPPGARLSVNGEFVGETEPDGTAVESSVPLLVTDLMPGQHQLRWDRPCSAPRLLPFNIPGIWLPGDLPMNTGRKWA